LYVVGRGTFHEAKRPSASRAVFTYVGSGINVDVLKFSHEKGLFRKHGVEISLIYHTTGPAATKAVVAGPA
jgi:ABC-type nitrate/sulfonate/bicarbonate transport system substrate-binding protein